MDIGNGLPVIWHLVVLQEPAVFCLSTPWITPVLDWPTTPNPRRKVLYPTIWSYFPRR